MFPPPPPRPVLSYRAAAPLRAERCQPPAASTAPSGGALGKERPRNGAAGGRVGGPAAAVPAEAAAERPARPTQRSVHLRSPLRDGEGLNAAIAGAQAAPLL